MRSEGGMGSQELLEAARSDLRELEAKTVKLRQEERRAFAHRMLWGPTCPCQAT